MNVYKPYYNMANSPQLKICVLIMENKLSRRLRHNCKRSLVRPDSEVVRSS